MYTNLNIIAKACKKAGIELYRKKDIFYKNCVLAKIINKILKINLTVYFRPFKLVKIDIVIY